MRLDKFATLLLLIVLASPSYANDFWKWVGGVNMGSDYDQDVFVSRSNSAAERDRVVRSALAKAERAMARAEAELDVSRFQNYFKRLDIQWDNDFLTNPANLNNIHAYGLLSEYLSRYMRTRYELVSTLVSVTEDYSILRRIDSGASSNPFERSEQERMRTATEKVSVVFDVTAHETALSINAGRLEKHSAELERAIDYGLKLEAEFRKAAGL